ncbi:leucine-rich repeat receptor-like serine/threonine-protein kinase SKM1 [Salvia miltiorrhiza]|uniref:leucine-rich repeat receptor-like serine/threonine-protein kinase SKM1 n=1 Tax=Salvia miltiorrhiza TaxID=226208 RepID=UPI0025ACB48D|nr:leucine-rich repeat receptor-like serine/threonine-protein kinase SKM1 [Salvia miltiorrhiza]
MVTTPPLPLLTLSLLYLAMHASSATHWQDVQVLKQLKGTIAPSSIPPASCIDSWDFSVDPCDSLFSDKFTCGFRCDDSSSRLTELTLDSAGYSAPLSAVSWSSLPYLQSLDLSANNFSGPIPQSLSGLPRLRRLALSRNSLSGPIPHSLGSLTQLEEMYLDNNMLNDSIPPALNGLKNLRRLEFQGNQLSGELPDLTQLATLNFLDASDNALSGNLPAALPPSLVELVARNNQIQGTIPAFAAPSLQVLDLSHNKLSGSVPASLFTHPSLEQLTLSFNQLDSVQVPGDSGLTSPLISVDLSDNRIRGLLPGFMGLMPRLSALSLENNELTGPIPAEYAMKVLGSGLGTAQFERLLLGGNYLFGAIPGGFLDLKAGSLTVRLGDNCLYRCPIRFFFCEGGVQKSFDQCRAFGPIIP